MSKVRTISGFPEWLPEQRLAELKVIETIRSAYESHGFTPIETPAVELLGTLKSEGEIQKQIYALHTAQGERKEDSEKTIALHFDLTVPFARYVATHFNNLIFPFKRYQLQKVWRGERAQAGRFREFYQFDIDTVAVDSLPLCHDAEFLSLIEKIFTKLDLGKIYVKVNNRKILKGLYQALGIESEAQAAAITVVDKIDKIGAEQVQAQLVSEVGLTAQVAEKIVSYTGIKCSAQQAEQTLTGLEVSDELFQEGMKEILEVFSFLTPGAKEVVKLDLSLARGLDYYSGTIFETLLIDNPGFGSVCGGGRYEDLASRFIKKKLPGVGMSIGLTRLMAHAFENNLLNLDQKSPTKALVAVYNEEQRTQCIELAEQLRGNGVTTDIFHKSPKLGKQIEYAMKKGIEWVVFISENGKIEAKNLIERTQEEIDPASWSA